MLKSAQKIEGSKTHHPTGSRHKHTSASVIPAPNSMQRSLGNQGMNHFVQAKLKIDQPNDPHEREADRVAGHVLQMQPLSSGHHASHQFNRRGDGRMVQRKASLPETTPNSNTNNVGGNLGQGKPLNAGVQSHFEPLFGTDLSGVRIHNDNRATQQARALNARAFTVGRNIVFDQGEYQPTTSKGKHLLAHELTHVMQQTGSAVENKSGPRISRQAQPIIQRTPGVDAEESWDVVVDQFLAPSGARGQTAIGAKNRMLRTTSGQRLINSLWRIFCRSRQSCRSHITVNFTTQLPPNSESASGMFEPDSPNQPRYTVWVLSRLPRDPADRSISLGGNWPGGRTTLISFTHGDPESGMASTLYHELLHVWFLHSGRQDIGYPTGHADVEEREIEPQFLELLRGFTRQLDVLEQQIHRQQAAARRAPPPPRPTVPPEAGPTPSPEPRTRREPSIVGGSVFARGGGFGGGGIEPGGTAIVGADLILGRIASFNLGVRGIYLTPDHLLAGGILGFRLTQGEERTHGVTRRVENPIFFDLEAGILGEIPVSESRRLTGDAQFLISAGFGQEYGTEGPRFFWRLGGFTLISDEGTALGGATGGVGARF